MSNDLTPPPPPPPSNNAESDASAPIAPKLKIAKPTVIPAVANIPPPPKASQIPFSPQVSNKVGVPAAMFDLVILLAAIAGASLLAIQLFVTTKG